ncbi:MAG TPA: electron transfer flavoprotein subunit alpha/FixB family protein [Deltaproteobacteria bacterium]|mgnify:FL=1|jgi:electron transfer flavoprotein alpha subunit|nr:electron transfer flavoprotein subunit alpha/FixB family protein [Deltaproteobacteria bacterium]HOI07142.1 electron transfer flavoprotein subunit alpha/FixB family protein [Deltaproteobacteria bacterium]
MAAKKRSIWVFGDYRNYFQNRVTLQLISRANDLARAIGAEVCVTVFGHGVDEWVWEYSCHGAHKIYVCDHESLKFYSNDVYIALMEKLVREHEPEILLIGATAFGREFAPRLAKRLGTGLTADCIGLDIGEDGLLVQTAPAFGGNMLTKIVTPVKRPQMATVRPGTFQEIPHDNDAKAEVVHVPLPDDLPKDRITLISSVRQPARGQKLEDAAVVVCGGRGMGSRKKFRNLYELARILGGEVGATRPVVYSKWADEEALVGQADKHIKPKVLISFGISGAIQHTAGIKDAGFIIAVNKNPNAVMMKMADVAIVADASQVCTALIKELKKRIRS